MTLNFEQIKSITRGAARVWETDGYVCLNRFTALQEQAYLNGPRPDLLPKVYTTAGMRLAFRTSSEHLFLTYRLRTASAGRMGWFDLYINGAMIQHVGTCGIPMTESRAELVLGEGEKDVELYLPYAARVELAAVELDDGATLTPIFRSKRLLCFGDSITQGNEAQYPSLTYVSALARLLDADVINKGIAGEWFFPSLLTDAETETPDLITVAYGTNDWRGLPRETVADRCQAFYSRLRALYPDTPIFAITPLWRGDTSNKTPFGEPADRMHGLIAACVAELPNVRVIRGWDMIPHVKEFFHDLFLHPNDLGFGIYAANLYREINFI